MQYRRVTVFGGSGFVGRHLVKRLAADGTIVRVAVRDAEAAKFLKPYGAVGQIVPMAANVRDEASVRTAIEGADAVVNLVGILAGSGRQTFAAVHAEAPARLASAAHEAGVARFVQMSAIGADPESPSEYARTKAAGEAGARGAFPGAVVVRPSLIVGPEDDLFNRFAAMARIAPALPLVGGGGTRFQPVYVGDVAEAIRWTLNDASAPGTTYELGGPQIYTFRELMELTLEVTGRRRMLLPLPSAAAAALAAVLQFLPGKPLTPDQVVLLGCDNVVADGMPGFREMGIVPTAIEAILPTYLDRFRKGGRFSAGPKRRRATAGSA